MNTRWLVIVLTAMFLFPEFACSVNGRLCQPGVYVFYGNGIWNDKQAADSSRDLLAERLESYVSGTDLEELITYATAHNPSNGILLDLLETYEQNNQTDWSRFWRCLASLDPIPDFLQNKLIEIANTVDEIVLRLNPAVQDHVEKYNKLLSEGNKVVVVAHSQGPDGHLLSPTCGRGKVPHPLMILTRGEERKKDCYSSTYSSPKVEI